jgi:hypothetical protein
MERKHMKKQTIKNGAAAIILGLLLVATPGHAEETRALTTLKGETVIVPRLVPEREQLVLLGVPVVEVETSTGKGRLILALYGDPTTERQARYAETYDLAGNLLEIAWYDQTGQMRVAQDKNVTDPDAKGPAKVFVMVMDVDAGLAFWSPALRSF